MKANCSIYIRSRNDPKQNDASHYLMLQLQLYLDIFAVVAIQRSTRVVLNFKIRLWASSSLHMIDDLQIIATAVGKAVTKAVTRNKIVFPKMVVISSKESYCHGIMQSMNQLRLEGRLCDVSLVVKDKTIDAHRCVLVAGSDYFKSRFTGPFKADTMPKVDLTTITNDAAAVELMLNFLYSGEATINSENVEPVLKVASFFMISELRDICTDFMERNLDLDTCLRYFLLSIDHMIPEVGERLAQTVKSRFHDHLIFENQSLEITPDQLLYLIQNYQIFENCSTADILVYVHNWVEFGESEAHELLGCDIIESVYTRGKKLQNVEEDLDTKTSESYGMLKTTIDIGKPKSVFHEKLKRIITKCSTQSKSETKVLRSLTSRSPKSESVVIAISPKQNLIELVDSEESHITFHNFQEDAAVFDVCVYIPRSRCWYYLHEGRLNNCFDQLGIEDSDLIYSLSRDNLFCVFPNDEFVKVFHLNDFSWTEINYVDREPSDTDFEMSGNDYGIFADNQTFYLLLRIAVYTSLDHENVVQIYFRCFKLTTDNRWQFIFSTPRINTDYQFGSFAAAFTSKTNEMMIVYKLSGELHVFIAEIDGDTVSKPIVYMITDHRGDVGLCNELHILENRGHFVILSLILTETGLAHVTCCFKYKFQSRLLTPVTDTFLDADPKDFAWCLSKRYPCEYKYSACDKNSLWLFGGSKDHGSSLIEVSIDNKGKLVYQPHKPPPFCVVTALAAGTINSAYLTSLKTVTRYLRD